MFNIIWRHFVCLHLYDKIKFLNVNLINFMAFTSADLVNIDAAIATGQRRVRLGNREIEYQSMEQMLKARDKIQLEINKADNALNNVTRPASYRIRTSKGL